MRLPLRPAGLTGRTLRLRLTILYGILFLVSGVGLVAVTDAVTQWFPPEPPPGHGLSHPYQVQLIIALGITAAVSVTLGWLVAGRIRPLQAITAATRQICEDDLHRRLAIPGPAGELKDLADTIEACWPGCRPPSTPSGTSSLTPPTNCAPRSPWNARRSRWPWPTPPPTLRSTCERVLAAGQPRNS